MSGYLEVKYPFKSNISLNPFKSWRRQWCILRPCPTRAGGGSLAVYCSEAGAAAGCVELPPGCLVRRAKSRSRPHAFAIFTDDKKPRVLFAAPTAHDAQLWMDKIRALLNGNKLLGMESLLKDSYSITLRDTELSRKCGLTSDGSLALTPQGVIISQQTRDQRFLVEWSCILGATLCDDKTVCSISIDSEFEHGAGILKVSLPLASELVAALRQRTRSRRLSRSHGDLRIVEKDTATSRRSSWGSEPAAVAVDDTDLVLDKAGAARGRLARSGARQLVSPTRAPTTQHHSMSDRRCSLISLASGIYEEIPDPPAARRLREAPTMDCLDGCPNIVQHGNNFGKDVKHFDQEPAYESVAEVAARARPPPPPPLPPRRAAAGTTKPGSTWNSLEHESAKHPARCAHGARRPPARCAHADQYRTQTLPKEKTKQSFSVFRKRLKSDTTLHISPKSETTKEITETKKKRFDFTPTKDIFKNFKVGRKMKGLKLTGNLTKIGETKSCEFLDGTEHVTTKRCSKSVENLDGNDGDSDFVDDLDDVDLSIHSNDDVMASLTLPPDIVELILKNREISMKQAHLAEDDYMPMSPVVPPAEQHYIVMSPRTNVPTLN